VVKVPEDGRYNLHVRAASNTLGGDFVLKNEAGVELKRVAIAGTGGWQKWSTTSDTTGVELKAGLQTLKVGFEGAATGSLFNFNWFELNHEIVPLRSRATWTKSASVSLREGRLLVQDALGLDQVNLRDPAGKVIARAKIANGFAELWTGTTRGILIAELTGPQRRELHSVVRAR
jgi:hypothetical protein